MAHQNQLANFHTLVFGSTPEIGFVIADMALSYGARVTISGSVQPKVDSKVKKLQSFYLSTTASNVRGFACDLGDKANPKTNLEWFLR